MTVPTVPLEYGYLIGCAVAFLFWLPLFILRKDVRQEMLVMGILIGLMSMGTSYYWWTQDWWHPATITGTRVGIEDFLSGFFTGGIMSVVYEVIFKKRLYHAKQLMPYPSALTVLLFLALATSWLFWGVGISSFWASALTMTGTVLALYYYRRDLSINSLASGALMALISFPIYFAIMFFTPGWIAATYDFEHLTGVLLAGIPIEEIIFWFLAGLLFGPFYEYWKGERLRRSTKR